MREFYDVIVCGGGTAGCVAALAAARAGKKILLVERQSQFGGMGTSGLVCHWLGGRSFDTDRWVVGGLFRELTEAAVERGVACLPRARDFTDVPYTPYGQFKGPLLAGVPFDPVGMICLLEQALLDEEVDCLLQCHVQAVTQHDGRVESVTLIGKDGTREVGAKAFVDATGDADVAAQAGAPFVIGDEEDGDIAGVSLMLQLEGVDEARFMAAMIAEDDPRHRQRLADLQARGLLDIPLHILVFVKLNRDGRFMVNGNWAPAGDALSSEWRSQAMMDLRVRLPHLIEVFRTHFPSLEKCYLRSVASDLGVRETRRITGLRRLTVAEVQAGVSTEDAIGLSCYGWDLGGSRNVGQPMHGKPKPEVVPIPYGIMVPKGVENVICPGRAVSVERQVLGPLRVMAPVMAMGEAAGLAAAQVVDEGCTFAALDCRALQSTLRKQGAILSAADTQPLDEGDAH